MNRIKIQTHRLDPLGTYPHQIFPKNLQLAHHLGIRNLDFLKLFLLFPQKDRNLVIQAARKLISFLPNHV